MTVLRGFVITITSGVGFSITGAILGLLIARFAPGYYDTVFGPDRTPVSHVQAGVVLGFLQGLAAGLIVGLAIVFAVAWSNSRVR